METHATVIAEASESSVSSLSSRRKVFSSIPENNISNSQFSDMEEYDGLADSDDDDGIAHYISQKKQESSVGRIPFIPSSIPKINIANISKKMFIRPVPPPVSSLDVSPPEIPLAPTSLKGDFAFADDIEYYRDEFENSASNGHDVRFRRRRSGSVRPSRSSHRKDKVLIPEGSSSVMNISDSPSTRVRKKVGSLIKLKTDAGEGKVNSLEKVEFPDEDPFSQPSEEVKNTSLKHHRSPHSLPISAIPSASDEINVDGNGRRSSARIREKGRLRQLLGAEVLGSFLFYFNFFFLFV
jgi:hypothetical protein